MKSTEKISFLEFLGSMIGGVMATIIQIPLTLGFIGLWAWVYGLCWDGIAQPIATYLEYNLPDIPWLVWFGILLIAHIVLIPWRVNKPLNLTKQEQLAAMGGRVAKLLTAIACIYLFRWFWL